ncbi:MAG: hypothetical protein R3C19_06440 [Planctomycetaceae bacterium]
MSGHSQWALLVCAVVLSGCQSTGSSRFPWLPLASRDEFSADKMSSVDELQPAFAANSSSTGQPSGGSGDQRAVASERVSRLIADAQRSVQSAGQSPTDPARLENAKHLYQQALQLDPRSAAAHHGIAVIADLEKNWGLAEIHYKQALARSPRDASLLNDLGYSYLLQNRFHESSEYLNQAIQVEPNHEHARINLALLSVKRGDRDAAYAQLSHLFPPQEAQRMLTRLENDVQSTANNVAATETPEIPRGASFDEAMRIAAQVGRQERLERQQRSAPAPIAPHGANPQWPGSSANQQDPRAIAQGAFPQGTFPQGTFPQGTFPQGTAAQGTFAPVSDTRTLQPPRLQPNLSQPNSGQFAAPLPQVLPAAVATSGTGRMGANVSTATLTNPPQNFQPPPQFHNIPYTQNVTPNIPGSNQYAGSGQPSAANNYPNSGQPVGGVVALNHEAGTTAAASNIQTASYPQTGTPGPSSFPGEQQPYSQSQYTQPAYSQPQYDQQRYGQPQYMQLGPVGSSAGNYGQYPATTSTANSQVSGLGLIQQVTPQSSLNGTGSPLNPRVSQAPMTGLNTGPDSLFPIGAPPRSMAAYENSAASGGEAYGLPPQQQPTSGPAFSSSPGSNSVLNGAMFPQTQSYLPTQQQFDVASQRYQNMSSVPSAIGMYPGGYPAAGQQPGYGVNPPNPSPYSTAAYGQSPAGQNTGLPVSPASYGSNPPQPTVAAPNPLAAYEQQLRNHDSDYHRALQQINNPQAGIEAVPAQY